MVCLVPVYHARHLPPSLQHRLSRQHWGLHLCHDLKTKTGGPRQRSCCQRACLWSGPAAIGRQRHFLHRMLDPQISSTAAPPYSIQSLPLWRSPQWMRDSFFRLVRGLRGPAYPAIRTPPGRRIDHLGGTTGHIIRDPGPAPRHRHRGLPGLPIQDA